MRLYHGSTVEIPRPDTKHSRGNLDFGRGFYLTSLETQAQRWALRKAALEHGSAVVNMYELVDDLGDASVLRFPENDGRWVEFVCACRRGQVPKAGADIIVGGVADDKVYEAVNMYARGYWDMQTTLKALRYYDRNDQYCFTSQEAIDSLLSFIGSYEVRA